MLFSPSESGHASMLVGVAALVAILGACRLGHPVAHDPLPDSAGNDRVHGDSSRAAFVVLTGDSTVVVPLDATLDAVTLKGWWVGAAEGTRVRAHGWLDAVFEPEANDEAVGVEVCVHAQPFGPCELDVYDGAADLWLAIQVDEAKIATWTLRSKRTQEPCSCVVVPGVSTDEDLDARVSPDDPGHPDEDAMSAEELEAYEASCDAGTELAARSYLGGVLYETGMGRDACWGRNIYAAAERHTPLRPEAVPLEGARPSVMSCVAGGSVDAFELDAPLDGTLVRCAAVQAEAAAAGCSTDVCQGTSAFALRRGELVHAIGSIDTAGGSCSCFAVEPLAKAACPSPFDPCGDAQRFVGLGEWAQFWVATDETAAVAMSDTELAVLRPGHHARVRVEPPIARVLGVEYHRDSALLELPEHPVVLRAAIPALAPSDVGFRGSARAWGQRCFAHLHAGELDFAEAACVAGLRQGGSDQTRGALTYNLGRIEEARGAVERALAYYCRSEHLRPGNEAVRSRIEGMEPSGTCN